MEEVLVSEEETAPAALSTFEDELDLDILENIPVVLSAEVGRSSLKIKDLLRLSEGSVVEFDRLAGEAIDVCVNNTIIAKGEVVVVNERYGIRLTQVLEAADRIRKI
ncbi:MAG: flagellar motor switch protein FliN [Oceanospirillaceae bacterium]|nr:flagellar motor switch protein FliN [Oceanospirillaceae bacterium]MBT4998870.1 flagellar motor switch protein FliN [Oceanospirillaceae bacterium]MBT5629182.1 flagellar motor switch protein FliN [Oceanospirillaceae bacterium]MBT6100963.1 flagellar motor switch protein FliN [Oceanospirillaceae bacterium]MBT7673604.1 flagellar motor switch protein FliN [Oceanospirillaceae bacterium]